MVGGAKEGVVHGFLATGLIWRFTQSLEEHFEGPLRELLKDLLQRQLDNEPLNEQWRSRCSYTVGILVGRWRR